MIFKKSAQYYDALYSFKDYSKESETIRSLIVKHKQTDDATLLDVACGTGHHISYLKDKFRCEGVDLSEELLAVARERNPDVNFHHGDMRTFDLGKQFDVVTCLFSAIGYMADTESLNAAVAAMDKHLKPGGVLMIEPWFTPKTYFTDTIHAVFVDKPDIKIARMNVSEEVDGRSRLYFHYMVATKAGVDVFTEDHMVTLFTDEEYANALRKANLDFEHDPVGLMNRGLYVATKAHLKV